MKVGSQGSVSVFIVPVDSAKGLLFRSCCGTNLPTAKAGLDMPAGT